MSFPGYCMAIIYYCAYIKGPNETGKCSNLLSIYHHTIFVHNTKHQPAIIFIFSNQTKRTERSRFGQVLMRSHVVKIELEILSALSPFWKWICGNGNGNGNKGVSEMASNDTYGRIGKVMMNNAHTKYTKNILLNKSVIICSVLYDIMIIDHFIVCKHFTPKWYTHRAKQTSLVMLVWWNGPPKVRCVHLYNGFQFRLVFILD